MDQAQDKRHRKPVHSLIVSFFFLLTGSLAITACGGGGGGGSSGTTANSANTAPDGGTGTTDTTTPTVPTGLSATATSPYEVRLAWLASTDDVGVAGYRIYRGSNQINTTTSTSYQDSGLAPSTAYTYSVLAYDSAGNLSARSASAAVTTPVPSSGNVYYGNPTTYLSLLSNLKPGDTLILEAGNYDDPNDVPGLPLFDLNGTPTQPITITGPDSGSRPVLLGRSMHNTIRFDNSSYITVRNLEVDGRDLGGDGVNSQGISHHITLENLYIHGVGADQQIVGISTNSAPTWNWVIRGCVIAGAGTGMYLGSPTGDNPFVAGVIEHNLFRDTIGYNIEIKHQNSRPSIAGMPTARSSTIVRHNVFSKSGNSSGGSMARPNLLVGHFPLSGTGMDDVYEIYGNFFYQNPSEVLFQGEGNIAFHDNLLVNDYGSAANIQPHHDVPRMIRVFHNTVVAKNSGISVTGGSTSYQQKVIGNAVFAASPINAVDQTGNITDSYANTKNYLNNPAGALGQLDLYPKIGMLKGTALDAGSFNTFTDWDLDFNGALRDGVFRGAYTAEGGNPGWLPKLENKP